MRFQRLLLVGLNPAIDHVIEAPGMAPGAHVPGRRLLREPAGKAVNVSRALAKLGRRSIVTGFVGRPDVADFRRSLAQAGPGRVTCRFVPVAGETRLSLTLLDPRTGGHLHVREPGFTVRPADIARLAQLLERLATAATLTVFSGSPPPGMRRPQLRRLVRAAGRRGGGVAVDASGPVLRDLLRRGMPRLALIKPNREELAGAIGVKRLTDAALLRTVRALTDRVECVAVSLGAEGALLAYRGEVLRGRLALPRRSIVSTVGCGDCFLAGLLDALLAGLAPRDMLAQALAVAAANALVPGPAGFDPGRAAQLRSGCRL